MKLVTFCVVSPTGPVNRIGALIDGHQDGRIVDLTTVIMGPLATRQLGDHGAEVIRIETLEGDTTRNSPPSTPAWLSRKAITTPPTC